MENGRITVLFNGTGHFHEYGTPEYEKLIPFEDRKPGSRSYGTIVIVVNNVQMSVSPSTPTCNSALNSSTTIICEKPKREKEMKQNRDRDIRRGGI